jgi:hypothetical protein
MRAWHPQDKLIRGEISSKRTLASSLTVASVLITALSLLAASCGGAAGGVAKPSGETSALEYVGGHWVRFSSPRPLSPEQWSVVDAYANFGTAVLAVYATHSVAPLATVVSAQSKVTAMFSRDLASGTDPEALYTSVTVDSVAIHGCRATLSLDLYYPGGRSLHYVSSWVRPFDAALLHGKGRRGGPKGTNAGSNASAGLTGSASLVQAEHAPWLFVGDNRVGGLTTPCGI